MREKGNEGGSVEGEKEAGGRRGARGREGG